MAFNSYMHPRNIYKDRPNFKKIAEDYPEFRLYAVPDFKGRIHVDFTDTDALRAVTKVLLKKDFNLEIEIPNGFLIPTVPQRLNYVLWIEDLLTLFPKDAKITSGIDIGTGPCAIFSLLGAKKNGWHFTSTETSDEAIQWARKNIKKNNLEDNIKVLKVKKDTVLQEILCSGEDSYHFCLCNPPFFENIDDIRRRKSKDKETIAEFAKKEEIFAEGGEVAFVKKMITDSLVLRDRISLYTSMFGRKKSFVEILKELQRIKDIVYTKTEFCQGNTIRWGVAWTFTKSIDFEKVSRPKLDKPKKAKPPFIYELPQHEKDKQSYTIKNFSRNIQSILHDLEIIFKVVKSAENFAEIHLTSEKNTWSNQRRKRRTELKVKSSDPNYSPSKDQETLSLECGGEENSKVLKCKDEVTCQNTVTESSAMEVEPDLSLSQVSTGIDLKNITETKSEIRETVIAASSNIKSEIPDEVLSSVSNNDMNFDDPSLSKPYNGTTLNILPKKRKRAENIDFNESNSDIKEDLQDNLNFFKVESNLDNLSTFKRQKLIGDISPNKRKASGMLNESPKRCKLDSKQDDDNIGFEPKSLLFSILKLRKSKECISLEMNCPPEYNRESMHQIFQFLKNKFQ